MNNIKLYNGDCLEIMKNMENNSVNFTLTDIPYAEVSKNGEERAKYSGQLRKLDKELADELTFDLNMFLEEVYRVTNNQVCIFCGREQFSQIYSFFSTKKGTTRPIVWEKTNPSPMNGQLIYLSGVEFAVWFKKSGTKTFNAHCKNVVFRHPCGRSKLHPTEKNHGLLEELILDNSNEGDIIFDPCMGSGSHLFIANKLNRKGIGIELDENYFKIAENRINDSLKLPDEN